MNSMLIRPAPILSSNPPANGAFRLKKKTASKQLLNPKATAAKSKRRENIAKVENTTIRINKIKLSIIDNLVDGN